DDFQPGVNFPCDSEHGLLHPVIDTRGLLGGLTTSPKENLQSPYEKRRFLFKTLPGLNDGCRRIILHWLLELTCIPKSNIPSTNGSFECQFGATPVPQKLPDENCAWALDLVTSGGFDGMGIGKFSVNSSAVC